MEEVASLVLEEDVFLSRSVEEVTSIEDEGVTNIELDVEVELRWLLVFEECVFWLKVAGEVFIVEEDGVMKSEVLLKFLT